MHPLKTETKVFKHRFMPFFVFLREVENRTPAQQQQLKAYYKDIVLSTELRWNIDDQS
jgi:hypothetical protein